MSGMITYVYDVQGEWKISLAPEVDVTHYRERGLCVAEGWRYRSTGIAERDRCRLQRKGLRIVGDRLDHIKKRLWGGRDGSRSKGERTRGVVAHTIRQFKFVGMALEGEWVSFGGGLDEALWQDCHMRWEEWRPLLAGRSLLFDEVERLLMVHGVRGLGGIDSESEDERLRRVLQLGVLRQEIRLRSAIRMEGGEARWRCERCQSGRERLIRTLCARCGGTCWYCDHCLLFGRSQACAPLLHFVPVKRDGSDDHRSTGQVLIRHDVALTPAQQRAAERAVHFATLRRKPVMLIWSVTGSGKTEMMFAVVAKVLERGGRVAVASPRKDVVNELSPRFRRAFPSIRIVTWHGDSEETWHAGELIITTTHQLLRSYQVFDLIIVDEVDAFPYRHDELLQKGVQRALRRDGQQIWLTATPPRSWQRAFRRGRLPGVTIPARYHGQPLPEPLITHERRLWERLKDGQAISSLLLFFKHVQRVCGQAYVFVPGLSRISQVVDWVERHMPKMRVTGVSSRDRSRTEKINAFRKGKVDCLVTTTILERGVTVSHAHVLILQADHPVFDEAALVQMSGRCGRSAAFPHGFVYWVATEATRDQRRALKHIRQMNWEAKRRGWLYECRAGKEGGCQ